MAVEASMRTFLEILQTKRPQSIYEWITDQNGEIRKMSTAEVKRLTIMRRKTWLIRCLRWAKWLPAELKNCDITKEGKKRRLKKWVEEEFGNQDTWMRGELEQSSIKH